MSLAWKHASGLAMICTLPNKLSMSYHTWAYFQGPGSLIHKFLSQILAGQMVRSNVQLDRLLMPGLLDSLRSWCSLYCTITFAFFGPLLFHSWLKMRLDVYLILLQNHYTSGSVPVISLSRHSMDRSPTLIIPSPESTLPHRFLMPLLCSTTPNSNKPLIQIKPLVV